MTICHLPNSALHVGLSAPPKSPLGMAMNDCHQNLDCDMDTTSIFFDLSKALETLPHPVILGALAGVRVHGGPQKSILGPLFFVLA